MRTPYSSVWRTASAVLFLVGFSASSGCNSGGAGANTAHLAGAVTIDGQPVPENAVGSIMFKPTGAGQAKSSSAEIKSGHYDSPATPKGYVKVFVSIYQPTGKMIREGGGNPYPEMKNLVAAEYGSGIDLTVSGDELEHDLALKSQ